MFVLSGITAVAKQQVVVVANKPFVKAFSGIKVANVVFIMRHLCSLSLLIITDYAKFTSFTYIL